VLLGLFECLNPFQAEISIELLFESNILGWRTWGGSAEKVFP
jgi:hypothetical protein